jgi:hypothetical protein
MVKGKADKAQIKQVPKSRAFASGDAALRISAADFIAWQDRLDLSNAAAARVLYVSVNTVATFRKTGAGPEIARQCRAIYLGVAPDDSWQFIAEAKELLATYRRIRP